MTRSTTTPTPLGRRSTLGGRFAPVPDEINGVDLPVEGTLPPELTGRYVRNGPNPLPGEEPGHLFTGHGMLHGVRLRDGRAEWYRNRWVRTGALEGRPYLTDEGIDYTAVPANTHVIEHGGRLFALVENGFPYEVDRDLATVGPCDFDGRLTTAMTAHPKTDPVTGDLHFFGYSPIPPFLTYHRLSADGTDLVSRPVEVAGPTMMHDFAITAEHVLWLDLPMTFQWERLASGMPFGWDEGYGARIGVMRQDDPACAVTWFEVDPCYVFHVGGAHTDARGRVVLDAARYAGADAAAMWEDSAPGSDPAGRAAATGAARMYRWTLDPRDGSSTGTPLEDRGVEFPTIDESLVGRAARWCYAIADRGVDGKRAGAVVKVDADGSTVAHELGPDVTAGEAVFVPSAAPGRAEDDGWLVTITTTRDGTASQLLVLDATDVAGAPVAAVTLPRGVPTGFHGSWFPDPT
ncbi:retinal pigment epithelial membrane protein [Actinomycetospora sp. NBRC 106375]|uniref:carotenoid oxygenase family protein n=1 Tax=Actinomycetospora sp. NBRC 106375 TaxID=3032207 RepID=UPI0024A300A4|nr:carotenoid oxygenase family protein [Actinomycetospora sp. NBRC 106375]GLZ45931.1 retinal pigment epithelial membrane protein [Actinomycetospora sp. NBRC 106375]